MGAAVVLATQLVLAHTLGHVGYGEYAYAFGWLQLTLVFAQGGFSMAALRYVAEYRARGQLSLLRGFVGRATQIALFEAIAIAIIMAACAVTCGSHSEYSINNFLIASAALPILSQLILHGAIVRGLGHVIASMVVCLVQPMLLLAGLLAANLLFPGHVSPRDALLVNFAAAGCALAIVIAVQRCYESALQLNIPSAFRTDEWFGTATQMMFATGFIFLHSRTGVVVSGLLLDARAAGTYALMERITDGATLGLTTISVLAAPTFSRLYTQGRTFDLQRYARLAAWGASGFMFATIVPLIFIGKPVLRMFGEDFVSGYPILIMLLAGAAISALSGTASLLLAMTGNHALNTRVAVGCACVNVALSFVLTPTFGITGTAAANLASLLLWNGCLVLLVRRSLNIWPNVGRLDSCRVI
jgi:O-antigen/teichoic acid export membrane protein